MTEQNGSPDPYVAVLADLRSQREKIDQAIAVLESLRGGPRYADGVGSAAGTSTASAVSQPVAPTAGDYLGMTIADAARKVLASRRRTMSTSEIYEEFKRGGLALTSAEPINVIGSVLTRRFEKAGDVVRVSRGIWGLQEWYPNRSFKKKAAKGGDTDSPIKSFSNIKPNPNDPGPPADAVTDDEVERFKKENPELADLV